MKNGTIDLAATLLIPNQFGMRANDSSFSIQLATADISAPTLFYLEFSLNRKTWHQATDANGDDISFTLTNNILKSFQVDPGIYWRLRFAAATGTVTYILNDD